jgi:iron complex outermembrane receptor protein
MSRALRCLAGLGHARRNCWRHDASLMILIAVLVPAVLHAQTSGGSRDATSAAATVDQSNELAEVTVTATRRDEAQSKVPVAITAFDRSSLEEREILKETDLQSEVPGLTVKTTASQNQVNYAIRGQTLDAFSGSSPGVLQYYNDVLVSNQTATAFYDLASVQVLKGPQGTLFGRNATGGAVLYNTAQPGDDWGGYFTVRNGDYHLQEYQGALDIPLVPQKAALRIAADFTNEDGYVRNVTDNTTLGDTDSKSMRITLKLTPTDALASTTVLQYGYYGGTELMGGLYSYYKLGQTNNGYALNSTAALLYTPGGPFWSPALASLVPGGIAQELATQQKNPYNESLPYTPLHISQEYYLENTSSYEIDPDLTVKNIVSYQHHETREDAALSGARLGVLDIAAYPNTDGFRYLINQWSEELQLQGLTLQQKLKYIVGFYAAVEDDNTDIPTVVGFSLPAPLEFFHHQWNNTDRTQAGYLQGTYDLSSWVPGLSATVGGRQTWEQITLTQGSLSNFAGYPKQALKENAPSWQGGLQEQLTPELLLYVVQRGSWRAGNFNGTTTPVDNQNEYGPEYTHDWEFGAKFAGKVFDHSLHVNLAIYDQITADVQRDIYFDINGAPSSFTHNVPQGEVKGVELDGEISLTNWLTFGVAGAFSDGSYPHGEVTLFGQSLTFSNYQDLARWTGSAYAQIRLPTPSSWGAMSFRADMYYQTSQAFTSLVNSIAPGTVLPGYALANLRYDWKDVMGSRASIGLYVKNLFNREYYLGGFGLGPDVGFNTAVPGAPRQFAAELTYKF